MLKFEVRLVTPDSTNSRAKNWNVLKKALQPLGKVHYTSAKENSYFYNFYIICYFSRPKLIYFLYL